MNARETNMKFDPKMLFEFLKNIFGDKEKKKGTNWTGLKHGGEGFNALTKNMTRASGAMREKAVSLIEDKQYFKAFLLDARAEQMDEINDYINDKNSLKQGVKMHPDEMAADLNEKIEARMGRIKDTDIYNNAQKDFARLLMDKDEMLQVDQEILSKHFSDRNPADAALIRAMNGTTEELANQVIQEPESVAGRKFEVNNPSIWDSVPEHAKTSIEQAQQERANAKNGRPGNDKKGPGDDRSGYEALMPEPDSGPGMGR